MAITGWPQSPIVFLPRNAASKSYSDYGLGQTLVYQCNMSLLRGALISVDFVESSYRREGLYRGSWSHAI